MQTAQDEGWWKDYNQEEGADPKKQGVGWTSRSIIWSVTFIIDSNNANDISDNDIGDDNKNADLNNITPI